MEIQGFPNYTIYKDGTILNHETFKIMGVTETREKCVVTLTYKGNKKLCAYSRLIAEHFIPQSNPKLVVIHKDKNHCNYHVDNLGCVKNGEDVRKYTPEEAYESRKRIGRISRNKRDKEGKVKPEQRKWRQSEKGHFIRNRNHWIEAKVREPCEGWDDYYFNKFIPSTHCELCHNEFNVNKSYKSQKCLEHDHISGYIRSICCRTCNQGLVRIFDTHRMILMAEIHRYHNR